MRLGLAGDLARTLGAQHLSLSDVGLSAGALAGEVRAYRQAIRRERVA
jgi:hypothetical protein